MMAKYSWNNTPGKESFRQARITAFGNYKTS